MVKECGNGLTNSTLHLSKTFAREDMDEQYFCKIKHVNRTEPITLEVEKVNVQRKCLLSSYLYSYSGNAFVSGAGGLRFKSRVGQIGLNVSNGLPPLQRFFGKSCVARAQ